MRQPLLVGLGVVFFILVLPILLLGIGYYPSCPLVSAQDSPCLAQDATIGALQLQVFAAQATGVTFQLTAMNAQPIINALETQVASGGGGAVVAAPNTAVGCQPYPIVETFDNNARGISEITQSAGRARVVDGTLEVRYSGNEDRLYIPLPGVCVQDNFYIEVTMDAVERGSDYGNFGFAIGNASQNDYHVFSLESGSILIMDFTSQTRNAMLVDGSYGGIIAEGGSAPVRLGVEGRNGVITIFVNDEEYDAYPVPLKGNAVAIYVGASYSLFNGSIIFFDNFTIRSAR
jgi:hypothetical protein